MLSVYCVEINAKNYVPLEYSSSLSKALEIITRQAVVKENDNVSNNSINL